MTMRGAIVATLMRQVVALGIGLATNIVLARTLGADGYGLYALAILLPTMLATLMELGVGPATVYYVGSGQLTVYGAVKQNARILGAVTIVGSFVVAAAIALGSDILFTGVDARLLLLASGAFPLLLAYSYSNSVLQGLQDFRSVNLAALAAPIGTALALAVALTVGSGPQAAVAAFVVGSCVGALFAVGKVHSRWRREKSNGPSQAPLLRYGWKAHASNILSFVNYRADIFIINFFLSPAAVGLYVVAVQLAERLWLLSQATSIVVLPRLSQLQADPDAQRRLTPRVARWILYLTVLGALFLASVAHLAIRVLFGAQFDSAVAVLYMLLPGVVLASVARVLANDLSAKGRPELNMYVAVAVASVNVILNIILIPPFGILGAAAATTTAYFVNAFAKITIYSKITQVRWPSFFLPTKDDYFLVRQAVARLAWSR